MTSSRDIENTDMEILLISHKYPPSTGGMEKQSFELITGLGKLTKVHAIVYTPEESRITFFLLLEKRIKRMLNAHPGISIVHFNDGLIATYSLLHRSYKHLVRSVTLHGLDVVFPSMIFQKMIIPKFNTFDQVFAVSEATANACSNRGISKDRIAVVNNGVDVSPKVPTTRTEVERMLSLKYGVEVVGKKILIAIGRPVKRKGFSWFIRNVLPGLDVDVILLLVGPIQTTRSFSSRFIEFLPGSMRDRIELFLGAASDERELRQLLDYPNQNPRVARMGKLPLEEMNEILSVADAFIMPNIEVPGDMEGFGLVCLEACMQGANVFAAASGGITDAIIPGKNGHLLPSGHAEVWSETLTLALSQKQHNTAHAEEIIDFTKNHFSWQKMCTAYLQHFIRLHNSRAVKRSERTIPQA